MERDDPADRRVDPTGIPSTGMWATVVDVDGDEVTVSVTDYDRDTHYFGPIPHLGVAPSPGARAFLHFDQRDRPAYAAIFA